MSKPEGIAIDNAAGLMTAEGRHTSGACEGERWLVTGGSRGLGRTLVDRLLAEGATVTTCGRVAPAATKHPKERFVVADVAIEQEVDRLYDEALSFMDAVDVVVNNAGVLGNGLLVDTSLEEWNRVFSTNVRGAFLVMRRAVEEFITTGGGRIVNVASAAANGLVGQGAYAASKSALISMTRAVAKEYGSRNVRCNAVVPGFFATDMTVDIDPKRRKFYENLAPENRFATAEEVVAAIMFLASPAASFITGDELWVSDSARDVPRVF
jgi:3-oxoacyl-[acyl-carrier protein] reductase